MGYIRLGAVSRMGVFPWIASLATIVEASEAQSR